MRGHLVNYKMQNNKNKIGDVMEKIEEFNRKKEILIRNIESAL